MSAPDKRSYNAISSIDMSSPEELNLERKKIKAPLWRGCSVFDLDGML